MSRDARWKTVKVSKITLSDKSLHAEVKGDEQLKLAFELMKNWMHDRDSGISVLHTKKDRFLIQCIED